MPLRSARHRRSCPRHVLSRPPPPVHDNRDALGKEPPSRTSSHRNQALLPALPRPSRPRTSNWRQGNTQNDNARPNIQTHRTGDEERSLDAGSSGRMRLGPGGLSVLPTLLIEAAPGTAAVWVTMWRSRREGKADAAGRRRRCRRCSSGSDDVRERYVLAAVRAGAAGQPGRAGALRRCPRSPALLRSGPDRVWPDEAGRAGRGARLDLRADQPWPTRPTEQTVAQLADVDRPFTKAPPTNTDATPPRRPQRRRSRVPSAAVSLIVRLGVRYTARYLTRVEVARVLAAKAGLALGPGPRGRGPLEQVDRYSESKRRPERQGWPRQSDRSTASAKARACGSPSSTGSMPCRASLDPSVRSATPRPRSIGSSCFDGSLARPPRQIRRADSHSD
jgi:hypothetical protein